MVSQVMGSVLTKPRKESAWPLGVKVVVVPSLSETVTGAASKVPVELVRKKFPPTALVLPAVKVTVNAMLLKLVPSLAPLAESWREAAAMV